MLWLSCPPPSLAGNRGWQPPCNPARAAPAAFHAPNTAEMLCWASRKKEMNEQFVSFRYQPGIISRNTSTATSMRVNSLVSFPVPKQFQYSVFKKLLRPVFKHQEELQGSCSASRGHQVAMQGEKWGRKCCFGRLPQGCVCLGLLWALGPGRGVRCGWEDIPGPDYVLVPPSVAALLGRSRGAFCCSTAQHSHLDCVLRGG